MHARELIELATVISAHGQVLLDATSSLDPEHVEQYWTASKIRLDRWAWWLKRFSELVATQSDQQKIHWSEVYSVLEEILTGEMLTRTWAAVLCGSDKKRGTDQYAPIGRSILIGHMEARHRAARLITKLHDVKADYSSQLQRLHRQVECWTDILIGHLTCTIADAREFAFDAYRAEDFAEDFNLRRRTTTGRWMWSLSVASLRSTFRRGTCFASPNSDINGRIAASIIACFPSEIFGSTGLINTPWLIRLSRAADDVQGMIDELLGQEGGQQATNISAISRLRRSRLQ